LTPAEGGNAEVGEEVGATDATIDGAAEVVDDGEWEGVEGAPAIGDLSVEDRGVSKSTAVSAQATAINKATAKHNKRADSDAATAAKGTPPQQGNVPTQVQPRQQQPKPQQPRSHRPQQPPQGDQQFNPYLGGPPPGGAMPPQFGMIPPYGPGGMHPGMMYPGMGPGGPPHFQGPPVMFHQPPPHLQASSGARAASAAGGDAAATPAPVAVPDTAAPAAASDAAPDATSGSA